MRMRLMKKMFIAKLFLILNILYPVPEENSLRLDEVKAINDADRLPIIPRVMRMQEDDDFEPNYITPGVIAACAFCAGVVGSVIGERCLPSSWDFSTDDVSVQSKLGAGVCIYGVTRLLLDRSANRKINQGCDALARLLHIKSE